MWFEMPSLDSCAEEEEVRRGDLAPVRVHRFEPCE